MTRNNTPDPAALLRSLTRRVQAVEQELTEIHQDVAALGRGMADLLAQVRRLTPAPGPTTAGPRLDDPDTPTTTAAAPDGAGEPDDGEGESGEGEVQRDWLAVTDTDTAAMWLAEAAQWAGVVLARHGVDLAQTPCWPLHPPVVVDLLALSAQRGSAYPQPDPTPVVEWLTRWLPAGIERITGELAGCAREHAHVHAGALYEASGLDSPEGLADAAAWWTTARDLSPGPTWLHLPAAA